ncbi:MAG: RDD family protein [Pseudomonadales bacterium]|nr:RDD family protein [Pseudomonadales bacterium]
MDAGSGNAMTNGQAVSRYFAYLASALPLGFGFIWIAFDRKNRGLHDLMCGTLVIKRDEGNGVVLASRVD